MEIKTQETYRCDWCKKLYIRKSAAVKHENECSKNPENYRACFGCVHAEKKSVWIYQENPMTTGKYLTSLVYCKVKDTFIYPPKTERKNNQYEQEDISDGKIPNVPMMKECNKSEYFF